MIKAVIFDFDGTICDSSEGIMECALNTVKSMGYDISSYTPQYLRRFIGPPLRDCFRITFGVKEEEIEECVKRYRELYNARGMFEMKPYEGIRELLYDLKELGIKRAVATNKMEELALRCVRSQNLYDAFDAVKGPEVDGGITKAMVISNALAQLGVPKDEALMVGDTTNDEKGAADAGVRFLSVGWGFGFTPDEADVNKPSEILDIVKEINSKEKEND